MKHMKTQKRLTPLRAIRACCLGCSENAPMVRDCEAHDCPLYPYRMGRMPQHGTSRPLKAMRNYCLQCVGGNAKQIAWCPCDGVHSTRCALWPYRFGKRPQTIFAKHGPLLITPELMPGADVNLDNLPVSLRKPCASLRFSTDASRTGQKASETPCAVITQLGSGFPAPEGISVETAAP